MRIIVSIFIGLLFSFAPVQAMGTVVPVEDATAAASLAPAAETTDLTASATSVEQTQAPFGLPGAVVFLQAHSADGPEWSALALAAAGAPTNDLPVSTSTDGLATDLARRILALRALGRDAEPLAVALESFVVDGHLGTTAFLNDDIFGILALRAAGRLPDREPLQSVLAYVVDSQRPDGGWGVTTSSGSDVDDTAAAIQALLSTGADHTAVEQGIAYLRSQQNTDGGWPFRKPARTNSASTSWALHALNANGQLTTEWRVGNQDPRDALLGFQNLDGGFRWQLNAGPSTVILTSYAVIALAGKSLATPLPPAAPVEPTPPPPSPPPAPVPTTPPAAALPPATPPLATVPAPPVALEQATARPADAPPVSVTPSAPSLSEADSTPSPQELSRTVRPAERSRPPGARAPQARVLGAATELAETGPSARDWVFVGIGVSFLMVGFFGLVSARRLETQYDRVGINFLELL